MLRLLAVLAAGAASVAIVRALSSRSPEGVASPLPPCPDDGSRRCYRDARAFSASPARVFAAAEAAVRELHGLTIGTPTEVEADAGAHTLTADFRVGLYRDRLRVAVLPDEAGGAVLHARSKARVWGQDFGVNERRVRALFEAVADALGA